MKKMMILLIFLYYVSTKTSTDQADKKNIYKKLSICALEEYKDENANKNVAEDVFIEQARRFYRLTPTSDEELKSIFTSAEFNNENKETEFIKQIKAWHVTNVVNKNPKKAKAAGIGVLGALSLLGVWIYRKIQQNNADYEAKKEILEKFIKKNYK